MKNCPRLESSARRIERKNLSRGRSIKDVDFGEKGGGRDEQIGGKPVKELNPVADLWTGGDTGGQRKGRNANGRRG